jgi:hypothetical protein
MKSKFLTTAVRRPTGLRYEMRDFLRKSRTSFK